MSPILLSQLCGSVKSVFWNTISTVYWTKLTWTGAMTAHGPPSNCSSAVCSFSLKTNPVIERRKSHLSTKRHLKICHSLLSIYKSNNLYIFFTLITYRHSKPQEHAGSTIRFDDCRRNWFDISVDYNWAVLNKSFFLNKKGYNMYI